MKTTAIKSNRSRLQVGVATAVLGLAMVSGPALAQEAEEAAADEQVIVVTGSLIRNPNLEASSPVLAVGEEEMQLRDLGNAEQLLRGLPGVVPGVGSTTNNGNNGYASVDLRGLGTQRNLVLLDGDRLVVANQLGTVDLNNIPLAMVERVDVLTGGASTTYGADAVTGVVNFVTKKNFAGVDLTTSYRMTDKSDGQVFRSDLTIGGNFGDGRGNAVLSVGYQKAKPVYQGARDVSVFGVSSVTGAASGSSFTSVPTAISFADADRQVNAAGTALVDFYNGFNFNPYNIFQTPFERFNIFGQARYEVADGIEVYGRSIFSKTKVATIIAPSGIFGEALTIPANNGFMSASIRDEICAQNFAAQNARANDATISAAARAIFAADAARYTSASCALQTGTTAYVAPTLDTSGNVVNPGVVGNSLTLPAVYRRTVEIGPRISDYTTQMFDTKVGVVIDVTDGISLDLSGAHGESQLDQLQSGYVLKSRVQQALNASNTTTCTVTTNNCVPLNLWGPAGSITPAMANFLNGSSSITIKNKLSQIRGVLSGDTGFSVAGGDNVTFALGGEYRTYSYRRIPDAFAQSPGELGGAGGATTPFSGGYNVSEMFGELNVPLMQDSPMFHSLTLELGGRYSKYNIKAAGNPAFDTWTYKAGLTWEPVESLKLRGNYQRAVRAPNINELFRPVSTGLTNLQIDPCAGAAPVGNVNLTAACIGQGAPSVGSIQNPSAGQANATTGGNPNIQPEKADTFTGGVIFQPDFVPGLTLTVDYYNIKVQDAITTATPADVLTACFGTNPAAITAAQAASAACTSIRRSTANGRLSGSPATVAGLPTPLTNNGRLITDGIDFSVNYKRDLGKVKLNWNMTGNWTNSLRFRASPTSYDRNCVGYFSANCGPSLGQVQPKFSFQQRTTLTYGQFDFSVLWRYIGAVEYEGQADDFAARGFTAASRNLFSGTITNAAGASSPYAGRQVNMNKIAAYNYIDLTGRFNVNENITLTMGVSNLFDKAPPMVGAQAGATGANSGNTFPNTYDPLGRSYNVAVGLRF